MDSSGSFGVPETPGNSLSFGILGNNDKPIDQETFLNNVELGREIETKPKPKTVSYV